MVDEANSEQVSATPEAVEAEGQSQEALIDYGDEQLPLSEVQKRLTQGEAATKEMQSLHRERADLRGQLEGYQKWADPIQERYNNDPQFQEGINSLYEGGAAAAPVSQENMRLNQLEMKDAIRDQERDFERLRAEGMKISKEDEQTILNEVAVNNTETPTVEAAYRKLYWKRDMDMATKGATAQTAEHMAQNAAAYETPPAGAAPTTSVSKDVNDLYKSDPDAHRDAVIADIKKAGFNTGWD